uniref:Uncharacterized protein n=1 Tax=Arundo donax TaxID=35708 RepID=A0A0A9BJM5_ARUDO
MLVCNNKCMVIHMLLRKISYLFLVMFMSYDLCRKSCIP